MQLKRPLKKEREENIIPLINVVFLMLMFFLIAGALKSFSTQDIKLPNLKQAEKLQRDAMQLLISEDGSLVFDGQTILKNDLQNYLSRNFSNLKEAKSLSIIADKNLEASVLIEVLEAIKAADVEKVNLIAIRKAE